MADELQDTRHAPGVHDGLDAQTDRRESFFANLSLSPQAVLGPSAHVANSGAVESCQPRDLQLPSSRLSPCSKSAFQICVERAGNKAGGFIFAPETGTTFDSKEEAYELYNYYSWEVGFGIRYGKSRRNAAKYQNNYRLPVRGRW